MNLGNLDEWVTYCSEIEGDNRYRDAQVAGSGWMVSGSTPPPALEDPLARIPLERSGECCQAAKRSKTAQGKLRHLELALRWLECPHPQSSTTLRRLIRREAERVKGELRTACEHGQVHR